MRKHSAASCTIVLVLFCFNQKPVENASQMKLGIGKFVSDVQIVP